jgi:MFS family permease
MNDPRTSDWNDLSRMWQADAAAVSLAEIDDHLARERRRMRVVIFVELAGVCLGVIAAAWLTFFTPFRWMGAITAVFAIVSSLAAVRMRREPAPSGAVDVLHSLKESIEREDWLAEKLRMGRALSFVALFAIVMVTSTQLTRFHTIPAAGLAAAMAGCIYVIGILAWNLVLTRRAHARRTRLEYIRGRLDE